MDGQVQITGASAIATAVEQLAPTSSIVIALAQMCDSDATRLRELEDTAAQRKQLVVAQALGSSHALGGSQTAIGAAEFAAVAAEGDRLLESLDMRRLAYGRSIRQTILLASRLATSSPTAAPLLPLRQEFRREVGCQRYLALHHRHLGTLCLHCEGDDFGILGTRSALQCRGCGHQLPLRHGTIIAASKLRLTTWFAAIQTVVAQPAVTADRLADHVGLRRVETARRVKNQTLTALEGPQPSIRLANLDSYLVSTPALSAAHRTRRGHRVQAASIGELSADEHVICDERGSPLPLH